MINYQDFQNKWNGKYVSILTPGKQCFDLVVEWTNNLGIPHFPNNPSPFPVQYAYQIYANFGPFQAQYFDRIANGPLNSPQAGDLIVWKPGYNGGAGHVGLSNGKSGIFSFDCFEQNDPVGSVCHVQSYGYGYMSSSGIYGWLRPKIQVLTDAQKVAQIDQEWKSTQPDSDFRYKVGKILGH